MRRRSNGEGSVYRRADGRWVGAVVFDNGRRRVVYGSTQREAREKQRELLRARDEGRPVAAGRGLTVGGYLEQWVTTTLAARVAAGRLKPSTLDSYRDLVERHIVPVLGREPLAKLTPAKVRGWLTAKLDETSARGQPLSPRTVAYAHAVLRKALADAMRDELVGRNVAALVEPPVVERTAVRPLTRDEAARVVDAAAADPLGVLWLVMLGVGLRRGEALALRWDDVDLDAATLTVRRSLQRVRGEKDATTGRRRGRLVETTPKTAASAATVALPAALVAALRVHRRDQAARRLAAPLWVDPGLVFTTAAGTPLEPRNVNRAWDALCERAGVRRCRVHDLRHSAASLMHGEGVDLKTVQTTLRHSRLSTTADLYTHVLEEVQRGAADRMDGLLRDLGAG